MESNEVKTEKKTSSTAEKPAMSKGKKPEAKMYPAVITKTVKLKDANKHRIHVTTEAPEGLYLIGNAHYKLEHTQKGFATLTGSAPISGNLKKITLRK
jgi:hypothetical protein